MTGPRILFLPDFGAQIGGGHVMRCLTLAEALEALGARCAFAAPPEASAVMERFGVGVERVDDGWPTDIAVVDGYDYGPADERALTERGLKVCAFDDLLRPHDCDLIVDSGLGRSGEDYPGRARVLAGPAYCPIRTAFTRVREAALARRTGEGGRVLVSLGLTDVGGVTARIVGRLRALPGWSAMDVVLGSAAQSLEAVRAMAEDDRRIVLHVDSQDMAELTRDADFAVGAGGISQWERACLGLPTLLLILAPNQEPSARRLAEMGAALALNPAGPQFDTLFGQCFARLAGDAALRRSISARSAALCDGKGAARVAEAILELVRAR